MANILAIETATKICSVALYKGDQIVALKEEGGAYSHAEKLTCFIQDIIKQSAIELDQIDAIAVSKGPGSYTGLRIGTSTAKGLAYSLGKPIISVDTLEAMAIGGKKLIESEQKDLLSINNKIRLCPMIDARRMEVYSGIFEFSEVKNVKPVSADIIDSDHHYQKYFENHILVYFGDGAEKCRAILQEEENTYYLSSPKFIPSAKYMGSIAQKKFAQGKFEDTAYYEPYYLKDFLATKPRKLL